MKKEIQEILETVRRLDQKIPKYVTKAEACKMLGVNPRTLNKMIERGDVKTEVVFENVKVLRRSLNC